MTDPNPLEARKKRNLALGLALAAFVVIVFLVTIAKYHATTAA
jgi:hypothetical protein